jgi:IS30 family transposase
LTTQKKVDRIIRKINARPMRCLGFNLPDEVFAKCIGVALAG